MVKRGGRPRHPRCTEPMASANVSSSADARLGSDSCVQQAVGVSASCIVAACSFWASRGSARSACGRGATPCSRFHAFRCDGEKQQQWSWQASASTQPQTWCWQGKGRESSLAIRRGAGKPIADHANDRSNTPYSGCLHLPGRASIRLNARDFMSDCPKPQRRRRTTTNYAVPRRTTQSRLHRAYDPRTALSTISRCDRVGTTSIRCLVPPSPKAEKAENKRRADQSPPNRPTPAECVVCCLAPGHRDKMQLAALRSIESRLAGRPT